MSVEEEEEEEAAEVVETVEEAVEAVEAYPVSEERRSSTYTYRKEERRSSESSVLDLDGYDEQTRLEADALLGSPTRRRPSDPLGEASRRNRVLYHYR